LPELVIIAIVEQILIKRYNVSNAVAKLRRLLCEQCFVQRAGIVSAEVQSEDGTRTACDAIEAELIERRQKREQQW